MGWIALSDPHRQVFDPNGLGRSAGATKATTRSGGVNELLSRGSIMLETRLPGDGRPRVLLSYQRSQPWVSGLSLQELPNGAIALVITQAEDVFHTVLEHDAVTQAEELRITYSWDAPARWGRLVIERIGSGKLFLKELRNPKPLALSDLRLMTLDQLHRQVDRTVTFFAISNEVEAVGPMPALTGAVPVLTAQGYRRADQIRRGDVLRCPDHGHVPVLRVLKRTVPALGSFTPVRLRAPYFGLQQDIVVGAGQQLRSSGSAVDYLFGRPRVRVPAAHLVNGVSAIRCPSQDLVTYHQFLMPQNEPCRVAGSAFETVFVGRLRRHRAAFHASLLGDTERSRLPEHPSPVYPLLDHFEAITLAELRAA